MGSLTTTKYAISRRYGLDGVGDRQHQIAVCVFSRRSSGFSHMENSLPALNLVLMAVKSGQVRSPFLLDLLSMEVQVSYCASAARIHATLVQKKSMFIPTLIRFAFDKGTMKMDDVATIGVTFGSLSLSLSWNIHLQKRQGH
ncbi:uncharacterized protein [Spinacia oleracea]|uniref:Uncharacterized protein isoform X4 n=1 Tax=Spinacia oleracea TaxID=3562 RepID=A0A9R0ISV3_SPIOL|nr:uncharacterized protein LOC110794067 isoform X4 [Spinacia oleracea]